MKIFDDDTSTDKEEGMYNGTFEDMINDRKRSLKSFKGTITEFFKDYDGTNFVGVRIEEDENGDPVGYHVSTVGVGKMESQLKMAKALHEISHNMIEEIVRDGVGDPTVIKAIVREALTGSRGVEDKTQRRGKNGKN